MTVENEIYEIGEEINLYETETNIVNNAIPKPEDLMNLLEEILIS